MISKTVNVGHASLFYGELMQIIMSFVLDNAKAKRNSETSKEKSPIQLSFMKSYELRFVFEGRSLSFANFFRFSITENILE